MEGGSAKPGNAATEKPPSLLTVQFLIWVAARPRSYCEAKEAWRSTCPLNSAWEDALAADLIAFEDNGGARSDKARVTLTARGRAVLAKR